MMVYYINENEVILNMKGFNTNSFIIDKVFNKLSKSKKKSKKYKADCEDFREDCVDKLVGSKEIEGPIVIDINV